MGIWHVINSFFSKTGFDLIDDSNLIICMLDDLYHPFSENR